MFPKTSLILSICLLCAACVETTSKPVPGTVIQPAGAPAQSQAKPLTQPSSVTSSPITTTSRTSASKTPASANTSRGTIEIGEIEAYSGPETQISATNIDLRD